MEHVKHEQDVLHRLEESRKAVKQKYDILKKDKASINRILNETFKPITTPLEKLVNITENNNVSSSKKKEDQEKNAAVKREKLSFSVKKEIEPNEFQTNNTDDDYSSDTTLDYVSSDDNDKLSQTIIDKKDHDGDVDEIAVIMANEKDLDKLFGVRKINNKYFLGKKEIFIRDGKILVGENKYDKTDGLIELIFKRAPKIDLITIDDGTAYTDILLLTHVYKTKFEEDGEIFNYNSKKLREIIIPLITGQKKRFVKKTGAGNVLPRFKVARRYPSLTNYVYWDDPNELVDRLRLLIAEKSAGNNAHINEIHSIIEELKEGGYIK